MTTILVTKAQIIDAVKTEPLLRGGLWIDYTGSGHQPSADCHVCLIGSVVRRNLAPETHGCVISEIAEENVYARSNNAWLRFVSNKFETEYGGVLAHGPWDRMLSDAEMEVLRERVARVLAKELPDIDFEIDIFDAVPAESAEVLYDDSPDAR